MKKTKYFLVAALVALQSFMAFSQEVGQVERLISPEIKASNEVVFRLKAPSATSVKLSGNWMPMVANANGQGSSRQLVEMTKDQAGVWSTNVQALAPELYGYTFIVDGVTTLDPSNLKVARDGTFRTESLLYIGGSASDLYWAKTGPKGSVHHNIGGFAPDTG